MGHSIEQQLLEALNQTTEPGARLRRYSAIERLLAELLGGQQEDLRSADKGIDILVARPNDVPIAVELKVFSAQNTKNLRNHAAELLATAVETRRSFRGEVVLSAVLLVTNADPRQNDAWMTSMVHRLVRSDDGVGYDSVLIGSASTHSLRWDYFTPRGAAANHVRPNSAIEAFRLLREGGAAPPRAAPTRYGYRPQRILFVADEWTSGHGGLSTLNRELASAVASAGVEAAVLVPRASEDDVRSASDLNVALVTSARVPGLTDHEALLLRPVFADREWEPDTIVGHGRILGPYAAAQQQQFFPGARRIHFVHTDAEQLETAKEVPGGGSHMNAADARRRLERDLAASADLVVGVGPLLTEAIRDELIGTGPQSKVICLVPGLRLTFDVASAHAPVRNRVLIVGRADDFRPKGIDIAAEALLRVADLWPASRPHPPALVIRGVPDHAASDVKTQLDTILEGRVTYYLRPYSDSEADLTQDLTQARVLLMPSRHEGFGLAAYEAIASGVPVLISSESGLAQFLQESRIDTSPSSIVTTRNSSTRLAIDRWADAIQHVLDHPDNSRSQALALRTAIRDAVNWEQSVARLLSELNAP